MALDKIVPWASFSLTFVVCVLAIPIWMLTTFATQGYVKENLGVVVKYVDERHAAALQYSDLNRAQIQVQLEKNNSVLDEIKSTVKVIEQRTWEYDHTTKRVSRDR